LVEEELSQPVDNSHRVAKRFRDDLYEVKTFRLATVPQRVEGERESQLTEQNQPVILLKKRAADPEEVKKLIAEATKAKEEERQRIFEEQQRDQAKREALAAQIKAKEEKKKRREQEKQGREKTGREREQAQKDKERKKNMSLEEKEILKEKQLHKLISPIVVKCMSKYSKSMDSDSFKRHAKEVGYFIV
jgi:[histone H3]-lysine36 N-trimethyltransferase